YICHFFEDLLIRDLDNRNRSAIINAIRYVGLIKDDSWKEIEVMESGFLDVNRKNHVQVFVTPSQNALKMIENIREKYRAGHDFSSMFEHDKHPLLVEPVIFGKNFLKIRAGYWIVPETKSRLERKGGKRLPRNAVER